MASEFQIDIPFKLIPEIDKEELSKVVKNISAAIGPSLSEELRKGITSGFKGAVGGSAPAGPRPPKAEAPSAPSASPTGSVNIAGISKAVTFLGDMDANIKTIASALKGNIFSSIDAQLRGIVAHLATSQAHLATIANRISVEGILVDMKAGPGAGPGPKAASALHVLRTGDVGQPPFESVPSSIEFAKMQIPEQKIRAVRETLFVLSEALGNVLKLDVSAKQLREVVPPEGASQPLIDMFRAFRETRDRLAAAVESTRAGKFSDVNTVASLVPAVIQQQRSLSNAIRGAGNISYPDKGRILGQLEILKLDTIASTGEGLLAATKTAGARTDPNIESHIVKLINSFMTILLHSVGGGLQAMLTKAASGNRVQAPENFGLFLQIFKDLGGTDVEKNLPGFVRTLLQRQGKVRLGEAPPEQERAIRAVMSASKGPAPLNISDMIRTVFEGAGGVHVDPRALEMNLREIFTILSAVSHIDVAQLPGVPRVFGDKIKIILGVMQQLLKFQGGVRKTVPGGTPFDVAQVFQTHNVGRSQSEFLEGLVTAVRNLYKQIGVKIGRSGAEKLLISQIKQQQAAGGPGVFSVGRPEEGLNIPLTQPIVSPTGPGVLFPGVRAVKETVNGVERVQEVLIAMVKPTRDFSANFAMADAEVTDLVSKLKSEGVTKAQQLDMIFEAMTKNSALLTTNFQEFITLLQSAVKITTKTGSDKEVSNLKTAVNLTKEMQVFLTTGGRGPTLGKNLIGLSIENQEKAYEAAVAARKAALARGEGINARDFASMRGKFFGVKEGGIVRQITDPQTGAAIKTLSTNFRLFEGDATSATNKVKVFSHETVKLAKNVRFTLGDAFRRVAQFGFASSAIFFAIRMFRDMVKTIVDVDSGLSKLRQFIIGTTASIDDLRVAAFSMGKEFGSSIEGILDSFVIFAQQGLQQKEIIDLTRNSMLLANTSTMDAKEATEALTAATRIFNIEMSDSERIVDSFVEVAAKNAVEAKQLADAVKRTGTAAKNAGVNFDELNAIVTAVAEATRQTGKEVGTSLKFIFRQIRRPEVTKELKGLGIESTMPGGGFRSFIDIITDLANKFDDLTDSQRQNIAYLIGGRRQYNSLLVLLERMDTVHKALNESMHSQGAAAERNKLRMQALDKQFQRFKTSLQEISFAVGSVAIGPFNFMLSMVGKLTTAFAALPTVLSASVIGFAAAGIGLARLFAEISMFSSGGDVKGLAGAAVRIFGFPVRGLGKDIKDVLIPAVKQLQAAWGNASSLSTIAGWSAFFTSVRGIEIPLGKAKSGFGILGVMLEKIGKFLISWPGIILLATTAVVAGSILMYKAFHKTTEEIAKSVHDNIEALRKETVGITDLQQAQSSASSARNALVKELSKPSALIEGGTGKSLTDLQENFLEKSIELARQVALNQPELLKKATTDEQKKLINDISDSIRKGIVPIREMSGAFDKLAESAGGANKKLQAAEMSKLIGRLADDAGRLTSKLRGITGVQNLIDIIDKTGDFKGKGIIDRIRHWIELSGAIQATGDMARGGLLKDSRELDKERFLILDTYKKLFKDIEHNVRSLGDVSVDVFNDFIIPALGEGAKKLDFFVEGYKQAGREITRQQLLLQLFLGKKFPGAFTRETALSTIMQKGLQPIEVTDLLKSKVVTEFIAVAANAGDAFFGDISEGIVKGTISGTEQSIVYLDKNLNQLVPLVGDAAVAFLKSMAEKAFFVTIDTFKKRAEQTDIMLQQMGTTGAIQRLGIVEGLKFELSPSSIAELSPEQFFKRKANLSLLEELTHVQQRLNTIREKSTSVDDDAAEGEFQLNAENMKEIATLSKLINLLSSVAEKERLVSNALHDQAKILDRLNESLVTIGISAKQAFGFLKGVPQDLLEAAPELATLLQRPTAPQLLAKQNPELVRSFLEAKMKRDAAIDLRKTQAIFLSKQTQLSKALAGAETPIPEKASALQAYLENRVNELKRIQMNRLVIENPEIVAQATKTSESMQKLHEGLKIPAGEVTSKVIEEAGTRIAKETSELASSLGGLASKSEKEFAAATVRVFDELNFTDKSLKEEDFARDLKLTFADIALKIRTTGIGVVDSLLSVDDAVTRRLGRLPIDRAQAEEEVNRRLTRITEKRQEIALREDLLRVGGLSGEEGRALSQSVVSAKAELGILTDEYRDAAIVANRLKAAQEQMVDVIKSNIEAFDRFRKQVLEEGLSTFARMVNAPTTGPFAGRLFSNISNLDTRQATLRELSSSELSARLLGDRILNVREIVQGRIQEALTRFSDTTRMISQLKNNLSTLSETTRQYKEIANEIEIATKRQAQFTEEIDRSRKFLAELDKVFVNIQKGFDLAKTMSDASDATGDILRKFKLFPEDVDIVNERISTLKNTIVDLQTKLDRGLIPETFRGLTEDTIKGLKDVLEKLDSPKAFTAGLDAFRRSMTDFLATFGKPLTSENIRDIRTNMVGELASRAKIAADIATLQTQIAQSGRGGLGLASTTGAISNTQFGSLEQVARLKQLQLEMIASQDKLRKLDKSLGGSLTKQLTEGLKDVTTNIFTAVKQSIASSFVDEIVGEIKKLVFSDKMSEEEKLLQERIKAIQDELEFNKKLAEETIADNTDLLTGYSNEQISFLTGLRDINTNFLGELRSILTGEPFAGSVSSLDNTIRQSASQANIESARARLAGLGSPFIAGSFSGGGAGGGGLLSRIFGGALGLFGGKEGLFADTNSKINFGSGLTGKGLGLITSIIGPALGGGGIGSSIGGLIGGKILPNILGKFLPSLLAGGSSLFATSAAGLGIAGAAGIPTSTAGLGAASTGLLAGPAAPFVIAGMAILGSLIGGLFSKNKSQKSISITSDTLESLISQTNNQLSIINRTMVGLRKDVTQPTPLPESFLFRSRLSPGAAFQSARNANISVQPVVNITVNAAGNKPQVTSFNSNGLVGGEGFRKAAEGFTREIVNAIDDSLLRGIQR